MIFQFGADLFYANAGRFAVDVGALASEVPEPVRWLVGDAGAITSVDYSAARVLRDLQADLGGKGVTLVLVHAQKFLLADLVRHRLIDLIGPERVFGALHAALAAIRPGAVRATAPPGAVDSPATAQAGR